MPKIVWNLNTNDEHVEIVFDQVDEFINTRRNIIKAVVNKEEQPASSKITVPQARVEVRV